MKMWMKALVWLGLGGGIGFFAGYQVGCRKTEKDVQDIQELVEKINSDQDEFNILIKKHEAEMTEMRRQYEDALDAQREYLGGKDDEILSEGQMEMDLDDDIDVDMEEEPEMPDDPFEEADEEESDSDGDEIQAFHPEDIRPFAITASEYLQNDPGYDKVELDYYTEDGVIFDPRREEKWTRPEQLLGIGWQARFAGSEGKAPREIYIQNDTMGDLYKITRIDNSFSELYEEE